MLIYKTVIARSQCDFRQRYIETIYTEFTVVQRLPSVRSTGFVIFEIGDAQKPPLRCHCRSYARVLRPPTVYTPNMNSAFYFRDTGMHKLYRNKKHRSSLQVKYLMYNFPENTYLNRSLYRVFLNFFFLSILYTLRFFYWYYWSHLRCYLHRSSIPADSYGLPLCQRYFPEYVVIARGN